MTSLAPLGVFMIVAVVDMDEASEQGGGGVRVEI
jgi:hypothetical protein